MLRDAGFEVDTTSTGKEALDRAAVRAPDAAIIELVLPDGDGVELCRALREWSTMPLIFVSSVSGERHRVRALQAGADDYVTKPFGPLELVARLHATMRRANPIADEPIVELDDLEINLAARVVRRRGREVHLTPIEFNPLRVLLHNRGRLLTHNALLRAVWGFAYEGDRQTLRAHMANLRRKLKLDEGLPNRHASWRRLPLGRPGFAGRGVRIPSCRVTSAIPRSRCGPCGRAGLSPKG